MKPIDRMTQDHNLARFLEAREELREKDPHMHYLLFELGVSPKTVAGMFGYLFEGDPNAYMQGNVNRNPVVGV
jgi:hypothetical protein